MQRNTIKCLIMATLTEADPFIQALKLPKIEKRPFAVFGNSEINLVITGIGKANASMAAAYSCVKFSPKWALNLGAAGGTAETSRHGDIFHIHKIIEPDRPHFIKNTPFEQIPDLLEGFPTAVLATQDRAISNVGTFRELSAITDLVDMEGAAVLQAFKKFETRCYLFKFISDTPYDVGDGRRVMDNIKTHSIPFCRFIIESVMPLLDSES